MASLVEDFYNSLTLKSDMRTNQWLLVHSPWPTICLCVLYLIGINVGQRIMAHRKPFDLKVPMVLYNLSLVLLSAYMVYELLMSSWLVPDFKLGCALVDSSDSPTSLRLAAVVWWYYFSKFIEFADTTFFVLRKKTNQITFLHLYHHTSMPLLWWIGTHYAPGGEAYFSATLNSAVHVVMYGYYLLSALGPWIQPYLWWKKYLTSLQLFQFGLVLVKTTLSVMSGCEYPRLFQKMLVLYMFSLIAFFSNFYYRTYCARSHTKVKVVCGKGHQSNGQLGYKQNMKNGKAE